MTAVTFALPAESSAFVRWLTKTRKEQFVVHGRIDDKVIAVVHTGVGAKKCAERLGEFLRNETPVAIVASGFCGATSDKLKPGDIVVARNYSTANLAERVQQVLPEAISGDLHSSDRVIDPAADRYAIGREHGAIAIDMETETIARLCGDNSIPLLVVRAVSDSPAAPFPAPPSVLFNIEAQRTRFPDLLAHLARNPAAIGRLAQFSKQIAFVRAKLADALCALVRQL